MLRESEGSLRIDTGVMGIPCVSLEICSALFAKIVRIGKCVVVNRAFFAFSKPADEIEEERVFALKCFCAVSNANLLATSSRDFARLW